MSTPVEFRPAIIARSIIRHEADASRLATTSSPARERGPEGDREPGRDLGGQVDVDEPRDAVAFEEPRGRARLPDQALVDLRAALDLLVRVDAHAGHEHALLADLHLVADRDALPGAGRARGCRTSGRRLHPRPGPPGRCASRRRRRSAPCARPRAASRSPRARSTGRRARPGRSDSSSRRAPGPRPGRGRRAPPPPPARCCRAGGCRESSGSRRSSSASKFACRYWSRLPMSCQ